MKTEAELGAVSLHPRGSLVWEHVSGFILGFGVRSQFGSQSHLQSLSRKDMRTKCCWCTEDRATHQAGCICTRDFQRVTSALCSKEWISWVTVEKALVADVSGAHLHLPGSCCLAQQVYFYTCSLYLQKSASERLCLRLLDLPETYARGWKCRELISLGTTFPQWLARVGR